MILYPLNNLTEIVKIKKIFRKLNKLIFIFIKLLKFLFIVQKINYYYFTEYLYQTILPDATLN